MASENQSKSGDWRERLGQLPTIDMPADSAPALPAGDRSDDPFPKLPGYELLSELGRGGRGIVYKARQISLNRLVAVKIMMPGSLSEAKDRQRFRLEAEAAGRLHHPNIARVHEIGEINGQRFLSMEYIEGRSLAQCLEQGPMTGQEAARHLLTIARALHHAHTHGIIHRDLKPSNILLDNQDQPHIVDFGLAKNLQSTSHPTHTGDILGTPGFMAPEQAAGYSDDLGPACDVYGLGALLFGMLTCRPPFQSDTVLRTLRIVLEQEPIPPSTLNAQVDKELETICLKCLEKEPRNRYRSAADLAEDLLRFLNGEPIRARGLNWYDRFARVLGRSQHDVEFGAWAPLLLLIAVVILAKQALLYALEFSTSPYADLWQFGARIGELAFIVAVFWWQRSGRLWPASLAERQLWSIFLGYILATWIIAMGVSATADNRAVNELQFEYQARSVLTGLVFFALGSSFWGGCYAFGLVFFALAALLPMRPTAGPFLFGLLWFLVLILIVVRLRRLHNAAPRRGADGSA